jgi:hypothetical protein
MDDVFRLSHVALVVVSLAATRARLGFCGHAAAAIERQAQDGIDEQYIGTASSASLLLCQPLATAGPYARALSLRGPGLHHIGLSVADLHGYVAGLAGSGWYLLPQSFKTISQGAVWLARPGVGTLVEVCAMPESTATPLVSCIEIPMAGARPDLLGRLGLPGRALNGVAVSADHRAWLTIAGRRLAADALSAA